MEVGDGIYLGLFDWFRLFGGYIAWGTTLICWIAALFLAGDLSCRGDESLVWVSVKMVGRACCSGTRGVMCHAAIYGRGRFDIIVIIGKCGGYIEITVVVVEWYKKCRLLKGQKYKVKWVTLDFWSRLWLCVFLGYFVVQDGYGYVFCNAADIESKFILARLLFLQ